MRIFGMEEFELADALARPENSTAAWRGLDLSPKRRPKVKRRRLITDRTRNRNWREWKSNRKGEN